MAGRWGWLLHRLLGGPDGDGEGAIGRDLVVKSSECYKDFGFYPLAQKSSTLNCIMESPTGTG